MIAFLHTITLCTSVPHSKAMWLGVGESRNELVLSLYHYDVKHS